jgi:excisionase family DNA binding protein
MTKLKLELPVELSGKHFLTVNELKTTFRVSSDCIYNAVHSGELKAVRIGRVIRVTPVAVAEWLEVRVGY